MQKLKGYKCFWSMRSKGTMQKTQEKNEWHLASIFLKKCSRSFSNSCLLFSSYLVSFEWFKIWWVHQLWLYKSSLYSRGKNETFEDFKLKILICFHSPIILEQTPHISPLHLPNWIVFVALEALGGGSKCFMSFRSKWTMCEDSTSFEFKCSLTRLFILVWKV
jgi:hypothetical protein